ncbi:hypothetical protein BKA70DRAFT_1565112 [Coprinopsis sp. MPI-PUGE-AT-0042]|nr:hypothetical protein BKA70DRAFT_1565112 [Coprinopsis sp. MPI-PUGE-AT-0042]
MHRCIQTPDILLNIFEAFLGDSTQENPLLGLSPLASLAQTCRTFHGLAIRTLWKEIPGLYVIAYLFPRGFITINSERSYCLPPAHSSNFEAFSARLAVYRPYVKSIGYNRAKIHDYKARSLHSSLLFLLLESSSVPTPLFPNVHHITIPCIQNLPMVSLLYPDLVLGPSVRSIILDTDDGMIEINSSLLPIPKGSTIQWDVIEATLVRAAPSLQSFAIKGPLLDGAFHLLERPHIDNIVRHLASPLTSIDISTVSVSPVIIKHLSRLPWLSSLTIAIGERNGQPVEAQQPSTLAFPSLDALRVVCLGYLRGCSFLVNLVAPVLRRCTLSILFEEEGRSSIEATLEPFLQRSRRSLKHLTINNENAFQLGYDTMSLIVPAKALEHLSRCPNLISLDVSPFAILDKLSDSDLASAFSCWPKLEVFHLHTDRKFVPFNLSFTAGGVYRAAKSCPNLRSLVLPCDFCLIPDVNDDDKPHLSLKIWDVCNSPIGSASRAGAWLRSNFPALQAIKCSDEFRGLAINPENRGCYTWANYQQEIFMLSQWVITNKYLITSRIH